MSQDQQKFQSLSLEDVISVSEVKAMGKLASNTTNTTEELRKAIRASLFNVANPADPSYGWFENGVKAKVLIAEKGGGWKVGRVRLSVEFLPDESTQVEASTEEKTGELDEFR